MDTEEKTLLLELTANIVTSWAGNSHLNIIAADLGVAVTSTYAALAALSEPGAPVELAVEYLPAVSERRSLASDDVIISMIDGKPYKTLKRHLGTHGLTPDEYRARYGLKPSYPMVAKNYAEMRRGLAKSIGLGRKPGAKVAKR